MILKAKQFSYFSYLSSVKKITFSYKYFHTSTANLLPSVSSSHTPFWKYSYLFVLIKKITFDYNYLSTNFFYLTITHLVYPPVKARFLVFFLSKSVLSKQTFVAILVRFVCWVFSNCNNDTFQVNKNRSERSFLIFMTLPPSLFEVNIHRWFFNI